MVLKYLCTLKNFEKKKLRKFFETIWFSTIEFKKDCKKFMKSNLNLNIHIYTFLAYFLKIPTYIVKKKKKEN